MANIEWNELVRVCSKCKSTLTQKKLKVNEEAGLLFIFFCPTCNVELEWRVTFAELVSETKGKNAEISKTDYPAQEPVEPVVFPPPGDMEEPDRAFLRSINIQVSAQKKNEGGLP